MGSTRMSASNPAFCLRQDYAAREWVKEGATPEKMLIGMPTYGRTFTLSDPAEYDIGAAVKGGGKPARFTREEGFASYYEVSVPAGYWTLSRRKLVRVLDED